MTGAWHKLVFVALLLPAALSACRTTPLDPALPSVPLPTYTVGDRFTFDDGRTDEVVSVEGDWVGWRRSNGYSWTGHRDFIMPSRDWQNRTRIGHLHTLTSPHGTIWPLQSGRSTWFTYTTRTKGTDGSGKRTYAYHWRCKVKAKETITVPAGTFETVPVTCLRHSNMTGTFYGERTWYYAPRAGHYVLYVDDSRSRGVRKKALQTYHLKLPELSEPQSEFYNTNLQTALQTVPSNATHSAAGAGLKISITPIRTYKGATDRYCREYRRTIEMAGREYNARGISCRMNDGRWHLQRLPSI
jgi:hypothetical protein